MAGIQNTDPNGRHHVLTQGAQKIAISCSLFIKNDLFTHAGSAAFSFFLSAIPVFLMIVVVATRLFNNSSLTLASLLSYFPVTSNYISEDIVNIDFLNVKKVGAFEIIVTFSILWAARKLFYSVQAGLAVIHRSQAQRTVIFSNILPIICEFIIVAIYAACIVVTSTAKSLIVSGVANAFLPPEIVAVLLFITQLLPFFLLFIFCFVSYKTVPKIKIRNRNAFLSACACTASFYIVQFAFFKFLNITKYNFIYGFMSNLIITMIVVYIFFQLFLFFAQYNFVCYYFDILLLSRIFLLPPVTDFSITANIFRLLYIKPYRLYKKYAVHYQPGTAIFSVNENADSMYYVYYGAVEESGSKIQHKMYIRGEILGETDIILHRQRSTQARALTETVLLKIPADIFTSMLVADVRASLKTNDILKDYIQTSETTSGSC